MINYIIQIAKDIVSPKNDSREPSVFKLHIALSEELDKLDPRDFLPDGQYEFVKVRLLARIWARKTTYNKMDHSDSTAFGDRVLAVLSKYAGEGSRAETRKFSFVADNELRQIIERDYKELSLILLPAGAWKSTVILAGSILEAILYDLLTKNSTIQARAESSPKAPEDASEKIKSILKGYWKLHDFIEVAGDLGLLPNARVNTFDQVLRDYRNFVHPKKEIRSQHPCSEAEAFMAKGALDGICNHLEKHIAGT